MAANLVLGMMKCDGMFVGQRIGDDVVFFNAREEFSTSSWTNVDQC